jgi:thymidylate synthase
MLAQQVGLEPGEFVWTGGDVHIYENHLKQVNEQLSRTPFDYPRLVINRKPKSIFDYTLEDFELVDYKHHPRLTGKVAV